MFLKKFKNGSLHNFYLMTLSQTAFSKVQISLLSMRTFFSRSDKILYLDISTSFVLDNLKWPNKRYHSVSAIGAKNSNVCLDIFFRVYLRLQVTLEQHTDPAFF